MFGVSALAANEFTDIDLDKMMSQSSQKNSRPVVIYSWSPHMSLSVRGLNEIQQYCQKKNQILVVVLDPDANLSVASEVAAKNKWPLQFLIINKSKKLISRGTRIHYPSYNLISQGSFASRLLPGYKNEQQLDDFQRKYLK